MCKRVAAILAEEADVADAVDFEPAPDDVLPTLIPDFPVCTRAERVATDLLAILQARLRDDAATRAGFLAGGGLCGPHTRLLSSLSAPREVCTALAHLLVERAGRLRDAARNGVATASLRDVMPVAAICLPHVAGIENALADHPDGRARFLVRQATILEWFADSMRRFAIRLDASDRSGLGREDHDAARQGQDALVGGPPADASAAWFRTR